MVRTRFAPSPTGRLHLGNLRVAVFNYLLTRRQGGAFVLRVEDTDRDRNVEGALEEILADLAWAGLDWDEGPDVGGRYGPYRQSEREDRHREMARSLLEKGTLYRCFCADDGGFERRIDAEGGAPGIGCGGGCRWLDPAEARARAGAGEGFVLRFPVPDGPIDFEDAVRGPVSVHGKDVGDFVCLRADGRATYNFAVVVDDVDMAITHVIRGAGHLSNTPKHALLFDALDVPRPVFAHLPMVLGGDRRKLSKREGSAGLDELRTAGFPPEAVLNYLSLLGWSPGDGREVLSREELVKAMDLDRVGAADAVFDVEKLTWVSQQHLARWSDDVLLARIRAFVDRTRFDLPDDHLDRAILALRSRFHTLAEVNENLDLLFPGAEVLREGWAQALLEPRGEEVVTAVREALVDASPWEAEGLGRTVRDVGRTLGVRGPGLFHPVRLALSGARSGPDLGIVLAGLGRDEALGRLGGQLEV